MKPLTEKDRVRKWARKFLSQYLEIEKEPLEDPDVETLVAFILKEIKRAERREREACAKLSEDMNYAPNSGFGRASKDIARIIRNRRKV